jgi:methionyl-tRNA synthetase
MVNCVVKFIDSKYAVRDVDALLSSYLDALEAVKLRAGLKIAMDLSARGNQYLQDNKIDNALFADNRTRCDTIMGVFVNLIYLLSALIYPTCPPRPTQSCASSMFR